MIKAKTTKEKKVVWLIAFLCVISNLSYYPFFQQLSFTRYTVIATWLLIGGSLLLIKYKQITFSTKAKWYFLLFVLFLINCMIIFFSTSEKVFQNHFFSPVIISFIIFLMATILGKTISKRGFRTILYAYIYSVTLYSIPLFFIYLMKLNLSSIIYEFGEKNEISVLLLCALILLMLVYRADNLFKMIFKTTGVVFLILDMIYLRCRSAFFGVIVLAITLLVSKKTDKKMKIVVLVAIISVIVYFATHVSALTVFLDDIIYAGRDSSNIDTVSSGRISQIKQGLQIFRQNPIFGTGSHKTTDMFYVSALVNYGLLSWPLLVMAIYPVVWSIKKLKKGDIYIVAFFTVATSIFFISLLEEVAPFGPGVRCYILWLMFGFLLSNNEKEVNYAQDRTRRTAKNTV